MRSRTGIKVVGFGFVYLLDRQEGWRRVAGLERRSGGGIPRLAGASAIQQPRDPLWAPVRDEP